MREIARLNSEHAIRVAVAIGVLGLELFRLDHKNIEHHYRRLRIGKKSKQSFSHSLLKGPQKCQKKENLLFVGYAQEVSMLVVRDGEGLSGVAIEVVLVVRELARAGSHSVGDRVQNLTI